MNPDLPTASRLPAHLTPPLDQFIKIIGDPTRWALLGEMIDGEPRMVMELARKLGRKPATISKHLYVLKRAGIVVFTRRLYQLPRHFVVSAEQRHLDFGHGLLRLPGPEQQPPK
jgi:DNA-binding transcriptional ArsR family regulator